MKKIVLGIVLCAAFIFAVRTSYAYTVALLQTNLSLGTKSSEVASMKYVLKEKGYYTGAINETFDQGTKTAVINFQNEFVILPADGVVGPATRAVLNTILQSLNTYVNASSTTSLTKNLQRGSSGLEVSLLQKFLKSQGLFDGESDGQFGTTTKNAVSAFQTRLEIYPADGVVGPLTRAIINPYVIEYPKFVVSGTSSYPVVATSTQLLRVIMPGDVYQEVGTILKPFLEKQKYLIAGGLWDNTYDIPTQNAVIAFKKSKNIIPTDAVVGPFTRAAINRMLDDEVVATTTPPALSTCDQGVQVGTTTFRLSTCTYQDVFIDKRGNKTMSIIITPSNPLTQYSYVIESDGLGSNIISGRVAGIVKGRVSILKTFLDTGLSANGRNPRVYTGQFKIRIFEGRIPTGNAYLYQDIRLTVRP